MEQAPPAPDESGPPPGVSGTDRPTLALVPTPNGPAKKKLSKQQVLAKYFWERRAEHMGPDREPETGWSIQRINAQLMGLVDYPEPLLESAVDAFLATARLGTVHPPWPLHIFIEDFSKFKSLASKAAP